MTAVNELDNQNTTLLIKQSLMLFMQLHLSWRLPSNFSLRLSWETDPPGAVFSSLDSSAAVGL